MSHHGQIEFLELERLTHAIYEQYGYDFREYAVSSLKRRVIAMLHKENLSTVSELTDRIKQSPDYFAKVLDNLTVTVTEMFRDPPVYKALRENVIPYLQTYPELKIWNAGCATGEEVYSTAILLREAGLYSRSLIYGTDINARALSRAREGIIASMAIESATRNYLESGGQYSFSRYYTAQYNAAILDSTLKKNLVFSDHNLVTDTHFGVMNLILCRNVLIYFSPSLQQKVLQLLWDSLRVGGFLCLGAKERLNVTPAFPGCHVFSKVDRIYQKKAI